MVLRVNIKSRYQVKIASVRSTARFITNVIIMVVFHILDAIAQDEEETLQTEETREVIFQSEGEVETDDEYEQRRTPQKKMSGNMEKMSMVIHLFGVTPEGESIRTTVYGFEPYFYVQMPNDSKATLADFTKKLHSRLKLKHLSPSIVKVSTVQKKVLYGYTADRKYPFAKLSVASLGAFRMLRGMFIKYETSEPCFSLGNGGPPLDIFDANLDPMIRFFHERNIDPCGWVEVSSTDDTQCQWDEISPLKKPPVPCAPFLIATWDIECYSESGNFPVAESGDPIIQIGVVLTRAGVHEKFIFVRGSCDPVPGATVISKATEKDMLVAWAEFMNERNPDILVGYNIFGFDERYLYKRAEKLGVDLDGLSRLNDLGSTVKLDEKFLSSSALGDNFLYTWSAHGHVQIDLYHYVRRGYNLPSYKLDSVCQHFMSGKMQGVDLSTPGKWLIKTKTTGDIIPGRYIVLLDETGDVTVDKLKVLEIQAGKGIIVDAPEDEAFDLGDAVKWAVVKDDVSPADIFRLDRGSSADRARVAAYCIQDCDLTYELYKKLDVFNNAMAMANTCPVPVSYIFMRGQGIKAESLIYKECLASGQLIKILGNPKNKVDESYEGAIVLDPVPGFYFDAPVGVADFASLYPSTIESENISHDSLVWTKDFDCSGKFLRYRFGVDTGPCSCAAGDACGTMKDGKYIHHVNLRTKEEIAFIATLDEKKKRLHELAEQHLQSSYFVGKTHGYKAGQPISTVPGVCYTDIDFDIWGPHPEDDMKKNPRKVITGRRVCRYAQMPGNAKGTLPTIVQKLLAARKAKRKEAEKESDPFRKALLDAEQLAYKLTANSLYGQLGSATFKIRLQDLAASVTAYGRKQILFARDVILEFYEKSRIVYGDTDSLFVAFNSQLKNPTEVEILKETIHLTEEAGKLVTKALKSPHDFEYDKTFYPFIIFSKKRYVGNKYEEDPEHFTQTSMGIVLKRRDNATVVKTIYGGAIKILLNKRDIPGATQFVKEKTRELVDGRMSMNQLIISKSLRAEYKTATLPAHKQLADRMAARDPGNAPTSGERIPYVYISAPVGQVESKLQGDHIEHPAYVKEKGLKLDAKYYIQRQLLNPVAQLFSLCLTQMPGYKGDLASIDAETAAGRILFDDALNQCDKSSQREFASRFGMTVKAPAAMPQRALAVVPAPAPAPAPAPKQIKLDRFLADKAYVEARKQPKRAVKEKKIDVNA